MEKVRGHIRLLSRLEAAAMEGEGVFGSIVVSLTPGACG